jgi:acyl-CoA thioesterase FadM
MKLGETFSIETQVLGCDEKRMHLFHRMYHGKTKELVATNEIMQLHINQSRKVVPMRSDLYDALSAIGKAHRS